ncbi:hypothetical protein HCDG_00368 [Histoplasma capsulatum H143]|uniref:Uncharacterized protein n=1 Tax=Ajellomyces capsulatus (strain H143) TaxID=544712 RepID=C6H547_AJECH|nr:hypothetical protein HCDG_00368 [Histoplasma capsulatum H143]
MVTRRGGEFLVQLRNLREDPTGSWRQSQTQIDGKSVSEELTWSMISKAVGK